MSTQAEEHASDATSPAWRQPTWAIPLILAGMAWAIVVGASMSLVDWRALVVPVLVAAFVLLIRYPIWGVYLLVVAIPMASAVPRGQIIPFFRLNEALLLAVFLAVFVRQRLRSEQLIRFNAVDAGFLVLLLTNCLLPFFVLLIRPTSLSADIIVPIFAPIQYYLWYLVLIGSLRHSMQIRRVLGLFIIVGIVVAMIGIVQAMNFQNFQGILNLIYANARTDLAVRVLRITSTLGGWNEFGSYMGMTLLVIFTLLIKRELFSRVLLAIAGLICFIGLALSGNWSSTISVFVGCGIIFFLSGRRVQLFQVAVVGGLVVAVLAILMVIPETQVIFLERLGRQFSSDNFVPSTIQTRFDLWGKILDYMQLEPSFFLVGAGPTPAYIIESASRSHPLIVFWNYTFSYLGTATEESFYLMVLLRFGIIALMGYLTFLVVVARWLWRWQQAAGLERTLRLMTLGCLITLVLASLTNAYFGYSGPSEVLWMLLGLVTAAAGRRMLTVRKRETLSVRGSAVPNLESGSRNESI